MAGIFHPRPVFAAKRTIVSPFPPLCNVKSIAEALSYLERHHFPLQCYLYHLHTTLFHGGGGDFVVRLQLKSQEVFQDFWQTLQPRRNLPIRVCWYLATERRANSILSSPSIRYRSHITSLRKGRGSLEMFVLDYGGEGESGMMT